MMRSLHATSDPLGGRGMVRAQRAFPQPLDFPRSSSHLFSPFKRAQISSRHPQRSPIITATVAATGQKSTAKLFPIQLHNVGR